MIRMRLQPGIVHALDSWMLFQEGCDGHGVLALALDAHAERLDAANEKISCAGIHRATEMNNHLAYFAHPLGIADRNAR